MDIFFNRVYQRQFFALVPSYLIMICGGMFVGYGVLNMYFSSELLKYYTTNAQLIFVAVSFHVSSIIGAISAGFLYNFLHILKLHSLNCLLMIIGSIILTSLSENYAGVVTARIIFGLGFGSCYVSSLMYGSEIASPNVRAQFIYLLHFFITVGIFLYSIFQLNIVTGAFSISFSIISGIIGYFRLKSSHIWLMQKNNQDALERLQYFQRDINSQDIQPEAMSIQAHIDDELQRNYKFLGRHNVSSFLIALLAKLGYLSIFNMLHNITRILYLTTFLSFGGFNYATIIMMAANVAGGITGFFILDLISKRFQYFLSASIISILLFIFATLIFALNNIYIFTPAIFFIPLEFLVGFGIGPLPVVLKAEIFPIKEKPYSIASIVAIEELIQISFVIVVYNILFSISNIIIVNIAIICFGAVLLVCAIGILLLLKDSRKKSLKIISTLYSNK